MVETEEAVSEEVVAVSDWAETLETFLQRRMKPIESRKQLREVTILLESLTLKLIISIKNASLTALKL